jgi:hypothetical protein
MKGDVVHERGAHALPALAARFAWITLADVVREQP